MVYNVAINKSLPGDFRLEIVRVPSASRKRKMEIPNIDVFDCFVGPPREHVSAHDSKAR
jgi:hypothetical protein